MTDIYHELIADNPRVGHAVLRIYADALATYHEATQNVLRNGAVCSHPRTGAPVENPYLKIRASQAAIISTLPRVQSDRVVALLEKASLCDLA